MSDMDEAEKQSTKSAEEGHGSDIDEEDESSISSTTDVSSKEFVEISRSQRIRELIAIDGDVMQIMTTAGESIKMLTETAAPGEEDKTNLEASQEAFATKTRDYTVAAQSVAARLRRQVYALEEANIIQCREAKAQGTTQAPPPGSRQPTRLGQRQEPPMPITNNGLGKVDVSWLNSRIDTVGKQKAAELWAEARKHLEKMVGERGHNGGTDGMEIDNAISTADPEPT